MTLEPVHPNERRTRPRARRRRLVSWACVLAAAALVLVPRVVPATVEEQRARLPPPALCSDPVEGVWMSHKYEPHQATWYIFTLRMRRTAQGAPTLVGDILARFWRGIPTEPNPTSCGPGHVDQSVFMTAQGTARALRVEFMGTSWRPEQSFCGPPPVAGEYNLDHFSGTIDPAIQEFQSVNNDGGDMVNDPTVFRRVRCVDTPTPPRLTLAPPPLAPPRRGWFAGCNRR